MNDRLSSRVAYDNTGQHYNLTRITQADGTINLVAFKEYSPLYLSCVSTSLAAYPDPHSCTASTYSLTFVISYALSFTAITATITHTILYFWKPIRLHFGRSLQEQPDIHARLMSNYRQGTISSCRISLWAKLFWCSTRVVVCVHIRYAFMFV